MKKYITSFKMKITFQSLTPWLLIVMVVVMHSCSFLESETVIPGLIKVGRPGLISAPGQGFPSHGIKEAYVYVKSDQLGIFQLPAVVPVIPYSTEEDIIISAGIKPNGSNNTSLPYPFYKQKKFNRSMKSGDVMVIDSMFEYVENVKFDFIEDFEGTARLTADLDGDPETSLVKTTAEKVGGNNGGHVALTSDKRNFEATTPTFFPNSDNAGGAIFLEFDYKADVTIQIGVQLQNRQLGEVKSFEFFIVPKQDWNHMYIELTPYISIPNVESYRVILKGDFMVGSTQSNIYLDNIKLLHF